MADDSIPEAKRKYRNGLTAEYLRGILDYEPDTGNFRWRFRRKGGSRVGDIAGAVHRSEESRPDNIYINIRIDGTDYRAHRLAWLYMTGRWPREEIDHKNAVGTDNRWGNLREATKSQNRMNVGLFRNNTSGVTGVNWAERSWRIQITIAGKKYTKRFKDFDEAVAARKQLVTEHFGEFRRK